jgi:hypothetical protein
MTSVVATAESERVDPRLPAVNVIIIHHHNTFICPSYYSPNTLASTFFYSSPRAMSRRPDPARAAQNQQTIKNLLKLESNKTCADCKRNKRMTTTSILSLVLLQIHDNT